MRVGFHTFDFNMSEESPIKPLIDSFRRRGHEVVFLDTNRASLENGKLVYPGLPVDGHLDAFITYLPSSDVNELRFGSRPGDVPYFTQLKMLDARFPSPTPYASQEVTNNKVEMSARFARAGVPHPVSYEGADLSVRKKILSEIRQGKSMIFKPSFGGNGAGIIKADSADAALKAFQEFDAKGESFLVQEFFNTVGSDGAAHDYRAFVAGDKVVAGIKCTIPAGDWKRNYDLGTTEEKYKFTPEQERDFIKAVRSAGLGYGSVDVLIDPQTGRHTVCEINDGVGFTDYEEALQGLNMADEIVRVLEKEYGEAPSASRKSFIAAAEGVTFDDTADGPKRGVQPSDMARRL